MGEATARVEAAWGMDPSNSHSQDSYCPPRPQIGVDTVSFCWPGSEGVDRLLRLNGLVIGDDHQPLRVVRASGNAVRLSRRLQGLGQVGAFPGASLLFVEGRAAALHAQDEDNHALAPLRQLNATQEQVTHDLSELLGAELDSIGAVRRIDLSGELHFRRGEDGQALMRVLDGLNSARYKLSAVRERGGPMLETVYWRTPGTNRPVLRAYDKGVESETALPGERIRIERQLRYSGQKRPSLEQFLGKDLGVAYAGPLGRWVSGDFIAGTADQLLSLLTDAGLIWPSYWASGSSWSSTGGRAHVPLWPARKLERICGSLCFIGKYGQGWPCWSPKQRQRRFAELREFGLLVLDQPVHIDAHALVEGLCEEWRNAA